MATGQGQGVVLGYLRYILGFDSLAFQEGVGDADKRLKAAQKSMAKTADRFKTIGSVMTVGITGPLVALAAKTVQGAKSQAAAVAQVDAAIKSMGNTAGLSSEKLAKFADKLEMKSLIDADEILQKSTANLLTFGNVAGENFLKAQQAAVDLATRMGGDLQGATLMVGKALNDPIKGLTALSRAGIQFTAQQKEQIKAMQEGGDTAGAQAIMLAELNKQFGGAAEAAAKAEPMRQVMVKLGQAGDAIGEKLLPIIPVLADYIGKLLDAFTGLSPEAQKFLIIATGIAAAAGPVALAFGGLLSGVSNILPLLPQLTTALGAGAGMTGVLIPLAAAVGAVYLAYKNWDKIGPWIDGVAERTTAAYNAIDGKLREIQAAADAHDKRFGVPSRSDFQKSIGDTLKEAVRTGDANLAAIQKWADDFDAAFLRIARSAGDGFGKMYRAAIDWTSRMVNDVRRWLVGGLDAIWESAGKKIDWIANKFKWLDDVVVRHSYIPDMVDSIGDHMRRLQQEMVDPADEATTTAAERFRTMQARISGILEELFPATKAYREELEKLALIEADTTLAPAVKDAAVMKQRFRVSDAQREANQETAIPDVVPIAGALDEAWATVARAGETAAKDIQAANEVAGQSFVDMANKSLNALSNLAQSIKSGGILDILSSAFNAFGQIAQSGILGKGLAGSFANFTAISGFRANGGPVTGGKSYIVGERGPEMFTPSRSGYVHANGANDNGGRGGSVRIEVVEGALFRPVVSQISGGVSAQTVASAAPSISGGTQKAIGRANSRRLA